MRLFHSLLFNLSWVEEEEEEDNGNPPAGVEGRGCTRRSAFRKRGRGPVTFVTAGTRSIVTQISLAEAFATGIKIWLAQIS